MLKTYLYIPEQLNNQINYTARVQNKSKAEVMRQAINKGLNAEKQGVSGAETLLELAKIGKKANFKGVHDSSRMDKLLWGKDWNKDE